MNRVPNNSVAPVWQPNILYPSDVLARIERQGEARSILSLTAASVPTAFSAANAAAYGGSAGGNNQTPFAFDTLPYDAIGIYVVGQGLVGSGSGFSLDIQWMEPYGYAVVAASNAMSLAGWIEVAGAYTGVPGAGASAVSFPLQLNAGAAPVAITNSVGGALSTAMTLLMPGTGNSGGLIYIPPALGIIRVGLICATNSWSGGTFEVMAVGRR